MRTNDIPFNIFLMDLTPQLIRSMRPTSTTEIFETGTRNFHKDGLFSVETFGPLGSPERDGRFSYIELHTRVFHPLVYKRLGSLKRLYLDILEGRRYAVFNTETFDFEPSNEMEGETGFSFFVRHFPDLKLEEGDSELRNLRVKLINKNKDKALTDKVLVMPAGLRDLMVETSGRTSEDEINKFYRSIISISNSLEMGREPSEDPLINNSRLQLQRQFNEIFESIFNMIKGKKGFAAAKWASRKIINGTANVISPMKITGTRIGETNTPGINHVQLGLYQTIKAVLPKTRYFLRSGWLGEVFSGNSEDEIRLTNPKTLRAEYVQPSPEAVERWTTRDGLDAQITRYKTPAFRNKPILIDGYYLGLLYWGEEGFRFFADINELPAGFDKRFVSPINMTSLYYLSGYREWGKLAGVVTRYPVTGQGSTFIANIYCKPTIVSSVKAELGRDWRRLGDDFICFEFPDQSKSVEYVNSMGIGVSYLSPLGADFDGDRCTFTAIYASDSIAEYEMLKGRKEWFLSSRGTLSKSADVDNVQLVLRNITGEA